MVSVSVIAGSDSVCTPMPAMDASIVECGTSVSERVSTGIGAGTDPGGELRIAAPVASGRLQVTALDEERPRTEHGLPILPFPGARAQKSQVAASATVHAVTRRSATS